MEWSRTVYLVLGVDVVAVSTVPLLFGQTLNSTCNSIVEIFRRPSKQSKNKIPFDWVCGSLTPSVEVGRFSRTLVIESFD